MYGFNSTSVNKVRSKMFTKRLNQEKRPPDLSLLPCQSVLKYRMQRTVYVAELWRSSYISSIDGPQFTEFGWDSESKAIWVDDIFPEDVKKLLIIQTPNHVTRMRATTSKRWATVKMILKKKVTIVTMKMTKRMIVTMIVTFFTIKSLIKSSTVYLSAKAMSEVHSIILILSKQ